MKKAFLFFIAIVVSTSLSACNLNKVAPMDELDEDGKFYYQNKELGFKVKFPDTFIYYQVQRKDTEEYKQIEFYVPSSDSNYPQEIQSYVKPITVRVYNESAWEDYDKKVYVEDIYTSLGNNGGKKYFVLFWGERPKDWRDKWNNEIQNEILNSFEF